jgi:hypothetical protein
VEVPTRHELLSSSIPRLPFFISFALNIKRRTYFKRGGRKVEILAEMLGEALISKIEINM